MFQSGRLLLSLLLLGLSYGQSAVADSTPVIAVIIDDMGDRLSLGRRALALEGDVTYSILPNTPHAVRFARQVHESGREVMLHMPMQSLDDVGPQKTSLHTSMDYREFNTAVAHLLASVPYISGINNHRGSLLTQRSGYMNWLMQDLNHKGRLYFVDSKTTPDTVAAGIAGQYNIPHTTRDIFLDHERDVEIINRQFEKLIKKARKKGHALAIGHPAAETLQVLEQRLPFVELEGVRLVRVSSYIAQSQSDIQPIKAQQWHTYLSH
jgi:polysaccharide deacetylase 2 family uncharacterized protein YibQ